MAGPFNIPFAGGNQKYNDSLYLASKLRAEANADLVNSDWVNRIFPVDVSFETAMIWAWGVKSWSLQGTCSYNSTSSWSLSATFPAGVAIAAMMKEYPVGTAGNPDPTAADGERDIVGPAINDVIDPMILSDINGVRNFGFYENDVPAVTPAYTPFPGALNPRNPRAIVFITIGKRAVFGGSIDYPYLIVDPATHRFSFPIEIQVDLQFISDAGIVGPFGTVVTDASFKSQKISSDTHDFTGTCLIDDGLGGTVTVPMQATAHINSLAQHGTGTIALALKINEWWPYSTRSGLPVWDSATGGSDNDPFA